MDAGLKEKVKLYKKEWWKKNWWEFVIWAFIYTAGYVVSMMYDMYLIAGVLAIGWIIVICRLNNKKMAYAEAKAFERAAVKKEAIGNER